MNLSRSKNMRLYGTHMKSLTSKCVALVGFVLLLKALLLPGFSGINVTDQKRLLGFGISSVPINIEFGSGKKKFLEVPQIIWGLNNQKIALARACLTARMLNRTLLMPSLSASLFYKEVDLLQPISFDKVFQFERFNSICQGYVQLGRFSEVLNRSDVVGLQKGSGRRWTIQRDLDQLREFNNHPYNKYEIIRVLGKNPFLWHDHWPVKDYAKVLDCLVLVDEISKEADKVVSRIREIGKKARDNVGSQNPLLEPVPYVAVHMRIEKDWMIHCKKLERRLNISEICSSEEQIVERVGNILALRPPVVIYLAVADSLLENKSILSGWKAEIFPFDKEKLGVVQIYKKQPYLIQSAIDYEVCLRSDVFVGNSFSTFSSLVVLDRTQKLMKMGVEELCTADIRWPSYAYNLQGDSNGPRRWVTNMSDSSLEAISYGSDHIPC